MRSPSNASIERVFHHNNSLPCFAFKGVDSDAANQVMDIIRDNFVNGDTSTNEAGESGIKLVDAVEFR